MEFSVNHPILFVLVGLIVAAVLGQSVYFLIKAYRRAKEIGVDEAMLKKIIATSAVFTIAPAVSIVISVIMLSPSLGIALPWLRLSVVGSLSYETIAAERAAAGMGVTLADLIGNMTASQYVSIAIVMTVSILVGIWLTPILAKRMQKGLNTFESKDKKWSEILQNSLFLGMISAFVGFVFCDVGLLWTEGSTRGLVPVCVMAVSALLMCGCGLVVKKKPEWRWVSDYALPISMVLGMACAIPFTAWLG